MNKNNLKFFKKFSSHNSSFPVFKDWFFFIDHKGLLYLEETEPKIFPNSLKDQRFLKSFFQNLTKNSQSRHSNYAYVSKCWDEFNFVRTASLECSPIIFHDFVKENSKYFLTYSEKLQIPFKPEEIGITPQGLLFQKIDLNDLEFGLFSSELSVKLYDKLSIKMDDLKFSWQEKSYKLNIL